MAAISQSIVQTVKKAISENSVMIFSKSYCPYCTRSKDIFDDLNVDYKALELNDDPQGPSIQQALQELTGQKTVPNIFINQKHIGGYDALKSALDSGKLQSLLKNTGAKL
ncbi:glutaredoxin [Phycomyces nitens]|nr:glutaredoxin [Phycomyces nitens]